MHGHAHKQKFQATYLWNLLGLEFPISSSADSLLMVSEPWNCGLFYFTSLSSLWAKYLLVHYSCCQFCIWLLSNERVILHSYFICFKVRSISGAQVHSVRRQVRKRRDYINLAKSLKKWVLLKVFPANYNQTSVNLTPGSFKLSLIWLKPTARGHLIFGSFLRVFCFITRINDTKWNKT